MLESAAADARDACLLRACAGTFLCFRAHDGRCSSVRRFAACVFSVLGLRVGIQILLCEGLGCRDVQGWLKSLGGHSQRDAECTDMGSGCPFMTTELHYRL